MTFNIALQFEDGVSRIITCNTGELVCDAAYRSKINIPLDCRDGACGTCKCFCESGTYEQGFYIEDALTDEEAEKGYVLSCQMTATTDCVLQIPATSHVCKTQVEDFEAKLVNIERDSATTVIFSLELEHPIKFLPGQYVNIKVPGTEETRSYSFSSAPNLARLSFLIRDVPDGLMSGFMRDKAQIQDSITFTGPYGAFYLRPTIRPIVMLAGGTGLAPFLSMLNWLLDNRTDQPILLAYGVNTSEDLVEIEALDALAKSITEFEYFTVVADPEEGHERSGYVTDHLNPDQLHDGKVDIYVCGPPPMVEGVRDWLQKAAITPRNFFFEKFT